MPTTHHEFYRLFAMAYVGFGALTWAATTPGQKIAALSAMALCGFVGWRHAETPSSRQAAWFAMWMALGFIWVAAVAPTPARSEVAPTYRSRPVEWWDHDAPRRRPHHVRRVWREAAIDHRQCQPTVAVVGDQYATEKGAQEEADKAWMQTARWQYGERYMDRAHADEAIYECGRSSVGSVAGQIFIRCRLAARPCRADRQGDR